MFKEAATQAAENVKQGWSVELPDLLILLRKQRWVVLGFAALVVAVVLVISLLTPNTYEAVAVIQLMPRAGQEMQTDQVIDLDSSSYLEFRDRARTELQVIRSRTLLEAVLTRFAASGGTQPSDDADGLAALERSLTVEPRKETRLIEIRVEHNDAAAARALANLIAEVYREESLQVRRDAAREARAWLQDKIIEYRGRVDAGNEALLAYRAAADLVDAQEDVHALGAQLDALNAASGALTRQRVELEIATAAHRRMAGAGQWAELARMFEDPMLLALSGEFAQVAGARAQIAARYGERHPDRIQAQAAVAQIEALLHEAVRENLSAEAAQLQGVRAQLGQVDQELDAVKLALLDRQRRLAQDGKLTRDLDRSVAFYESLAQRDKELELSMETQLNGIRIMDPAVVPRAPVKPRVLLNVAVGLFVGLLGGVGLALYREHLDDSIRSPLDVRAHLGVPFLGHLPRLPELAEGEVEGLYTFRHGRSAVAEAVMGLRAVLALDPSGRPPRRILLTSAAAREGKTSTSSWLGIAYASLGQRVCLVECDLRRPRLHKVFGIEHPLGTADVLRGNTHVDAAVVPTEVPGLHLMPAGGRVEHPGPLLASGAMGRLLDQLQERFDVILVDSPPSAELSDAVALSRLVDGTVVVVQAQRISRILVKHTIGRLKQVDARVLGVVLNRVELGSGGNRYYSSYGRYGYDYDEEDDAAA